MTADDDPLYSVLVAHKLSMTEVYEAAGVGSSQYHDLRKAGRLLSADRVLRAARHFGINPVELLAECGVISPRDAVDYVEAHRREAADFFTDEAAGRRRSRSAKLSKMPLRDDAAPL